MQIERRLITEMPVAMDDEAGGGEGDSFQEQVAGAASSLLIGERE